MSFKVEVLDNYDRAAASRIAELLPASGSVVLTGGSTAAAVYPELARAGADWSGIEIVFSDERCVPPDSPDSNFGMAKRTLLDHIEVGQVHRMEGEAPPQKAADEYHVALAGIATRRFDLMLLGMGADAHICALFPGAPALRVDSSLCVPVERPDGLTGLTLTPPAVIAARKVLLLVSGEGKAEAVERAIRSGDDVYRSPVRLLAAHPDATFVLDRAAAARLDPS